MSTRDEPSTSAPSPDVDAGTTTRRRRLQHGTDGSARPTAAASGALPRSEAEPLGIMVLDPDGTAAGHSHDLCNALAERGSRVHLFTGPGWRRAVGGCRTRKYRVRVEFPELAGSGTGDGPGSSVAEGFRSALRLLAYFWTLLRLLPVTRRFDVVHARSMPVPVLDAAWLWLVGRRSTVACTASGSDTGEGVGWWSRRGRWAARRSADLLFVHSEADARRLRSELGVARDRIVRVHHGSAAHLRDLRERAPSCPLGHGGEPVILFLGPLHPRAGVDVLLKAANHLRRTVWDFRVVVAGPGSAVVTDYEDLVRDLGLERLVEFRLGRVGEDEIPAYLRQATVLALPFRGSGDTDAAIAACTFGKPVVASRIGGLAELVQEADNGILIRPDDPKGMADALTRVLRDDHLRRRYETNSLIYARTDLSWRRIGGDMAVAYRRALNGRPAATAVTGV